MKAIAASTVLAALSLSACRSNTGHDTDPLPLAQHEPRSKLHAQRTAVQQLRFAAIDFHQHLLLPDDRKFVSAADIVKVMDAWNVAKLVHLTGGQDRLQIVLDTFVKPYPDRFIVFTEPDWAHLEHDDFGARMARDVRRDVARGARGLKILKWLGLGARHANGSLVKVDDPRFDPVWSACADLGIPVAIHTGDPEAFFDPVDRFNERYEELTQHPDWSFNDAQWPRLPDLLAARDKVIARHPRTLFVALHVGGWPENLDYVSQLLARHPNVYVDLGARQAELGRQPRRSRQFFVDHQERIVFGTDESPAPWNHNGADVYESYARFLETEDEAFSYYGAPRQGRWTISGLGLPEDVLRKIYVDNARKIFAAAKVPASHATP